MKKIMFIGAGNMASAIVSGILKSKICLPHDIVLFDKNEEQYSKFNESCTKALTIKDGIENSSHIFFSVKPQNIKEILNDIKDLDLSDKIFISICAGVTIDSISNIIGNDKKVIRTMPNTPLMIGEGVTALCRNNYVSDDEFDFVSSLFSSSGFTAELDETEINRITAITSSSPAYVYLFAKSILDGASKMGIHNEKTLEMICKTIIGSAKMILATQKPLDELISMVKSPNGTTEKALNVFDENDFSEIIYKAMLACAKRADELSNIN